MLHVTWWWTSLSLIFYNQTKKHHCSKIFYLRASQYDEVPLSLQEASNDYGLLHDPDIVDDYSVQRPLWKQFQTVYGKVLKLLLGPFCVQGQGMLAIC